jgi:hypothetical protein
VLKLQLPEVSATTIWVGFACRSKTSSINETRQSLLYRKYTVELVGYDYLRRSVETDCPADDEDLLAITGSRT